MHVIKLPIAKFLLIYFIDTLIITVWFLNISKRVSLKTLPTYKTVGWATGNRSEKRVNRSTVPLGTWVESIISVIFDLINFFLVGGGRFRYRTRSRRRRRQRIATYWRLNRYRWCFRRKCLSAVHTGIDDSSKYIPMIEFMATHRYLF